MNKYITSLIDNLIRENAYKADYHYSYSACDLSDKDFRKLTSSLLNQDANFREHIKDYIDTLIQARIGFIQSEDAHQADLVPYHDPINGEIKYHKRYF